MNPEQSEARFNRWLESTREEEWHRSGYRQEIGLQPLEDIHLYSNLAYEIEPDSQGDGRAVQVLKLIAVFILVLAWVNYINLSTARALERAREVGIRKITGAYRQQLVKQFLFEYMGLNLMAAVLALFLVFSLMPYFNRMILTSLSFRFLLGSERLPTLVWLCLGGTFLAGVYPAVLLSAFRPWIDSVGSSHSHPWLFPIRVRCRVCLGIFETSGIVIIRGQPEQDDGLDPRLRRNFWHIHRSGRSP